MSWPRVTIPYPVADARELAEQIIGTADGIEYDTRPEKPDARDDN